VGVRPTDSLQQCGGLVRVEPERGETEKKEGED